MRSGCTTLHRTLRQALSLAALATALSPASASAQAVEAATRSELPARADTSALSVPATTAGALVRNDSSAVNSAAGGDTAAFRPVLMRASHLAPRLGGRFGRLPGVDDPRDSLASSSARRFDRARFAVATGSLVAIDALLMVALSDLWYTERAAWHWYSDAPPERLIRDDGWLDDWHTYAQMDKVGHVITTWHLARGAGAVGRWTGLSDRAAGVFGGVLALGFQTQIEFLDGYDASYGASRTDIVANVVGGVIGGLQVAHPRRTAWFTSKFSHHPSPYSDETTSAVGNAIKDYDGQSYWLVVRPSELGGSRWWPRWLAASVGYGADRLEHPYSGVTSGGAPGGPWHRREFYIGLDLDVLESERDRLPRLLRPVASALSVFRLPMPALQFGPAGTRWHWLFY